MPLLWAGEPFSVPQRAPTIDGLEVSQWVGYHDHRRSSSSPYKGPTLVSFPHTLSFHPSELTLCCSSGSATPRNATVISRHRARETGPL